MFRVHMSKQNQYLLLCGWRNRKRTKWPPTGYCCSFFWPNGQKLTPWGWHEGQMSSSGTCAHSPAPCSSIGIHERETRVSWSAIGAPFSSQMRAGSNWAQVTGVKVSGDAMVDIVLPVTSSSSLAVDQWWSLKGGKDPHVIANGTLTAVRHWDEILSEVVRAYTGAVGLCSSWCRTMSV